MVQPRNRFRITTMAVYGALRSMAINEVTK